MNNILFSKNSDNWRTPKEVYKCFMDDGYFDPCPYNSSFDGLNIEWHDKNFVNPPYSKIKNFVDKGIEEHKKVKKLYFYYLLEQIHDILEN